MKVQYTRYLPDLIMPKEWWLRCIFGFITDKKNAGINDTLTFVWYAQMVGTFTAPPWTETEVLHQQKLLPRVKL
jgi:hypothetical protein